MVSLSVAHALLMLFSMNVAEARHAPGDARLTPRRSTTPTTRQRIRPGIAQSSSPSRHTSSHYTHTNGIRHGIGWENPGHWVWDPLGQWTLGDCHPSLR